MPLNMHLIKFSGFNDFTNKLQSDYENSVLHLWAERGLLQWFLIMIKTSCLGFKACFKMNLSTYLWGYLIKTCISDCGSLSGPNNGDVNFATTTYNSVATFSCNTGYDQSGALSATCLDTGSWSASPPTCTIVGKSQCLY